MKIVYMGTPEFAVESLKALLGKYDIAAVVTVPDKPAGRGREVKQSEVKKFALDNQLPVLQPERLRDEDFIAALKHLNADLFVVVAFRMLPEVVWSIPPKGTINLHASLLPNYRGAAPINHALINGEAQTGVTTFLISHEIDTGEILMQTKVNIDNDETAGELHDKLMHTGASLLLETVANIDSGNINPQAQPDNLAGVKSAPKLFRENCEINWCATSTEIKNFIRGLSPYPCAWSTITNGQEIIQIKIYKASAEIESTCGECGTIKTDGKNYIKVACGNGYINILELQMQGKKTMAVKTFLAGFRNIKDYKFGK